MKSSLKISSAILLMAIFFITNPAPASADFLGLPSKYDYMAKNGYFSEAQLDDSCDFSKIKRVFVLDTDTSALEEVKIDAAALAKANADFAKKMKPKLVDRDKADALVKIKLKDWTSKYDHTVPERTVYEAYEYYEGYKDVDEYETRTFRNPQTGKNETRRERVRRKKWTKSSTWFFGSRRVVTPYRTFDSRKITSSTPFPNSERVVYPPYDVYKSTTAAVFEIYDAKSGRLIMRREGKLSAEIKNHQLELYKGLCNAFFKGYKKSVQDNEKLKKQRAKNKQAS